jgi:hypothetical protein
MCDILEETPLKSFHSSDLNYLSFEREKVMRIHDEIDTDLHLNCSTPVQDLEAATKSNSLIEFEENEKILEDQSLQMFQNLSDDLSVNLTLKQPINQMESLVQSLRENFNYKIHENDTMTMMMMNSSQILPLNFKNTAVNKSELETKLEDEILKREHCEKQIQNLNQNLLRLEQELAIVNDQSKKREIQARAFDLNVQKCLREWKQKENEIENSINNLKNEKNNILKQQTKLSLVKKKTFSSIEKIESF